MTTTTTTDPDAIVVEERFAATVTRTVYGDGEETFSFHVSPFQFPCTYCLADVGESCHNNPLEGNYYKPATPCRTHQNRTDRANDVHRAIDMAVTS